METELKPITVIAGATSGIGKALAFNLSRLDHKVIIIGRCSEKLDKVIKDISGEDSSKIYTEMCNLGDFENTLEKFRHINKIHGSINNVVWSAGKELIGSTKSIQLTNLRQVFETSVEGYFGCLKCITSSGFWHKRGGSLTVVSSVAAKSGNSGMVAYSASKSTILGSIKPLSIEMAPIKVRVNAILFGAVETEMHQRIISKMPIEMINEYRKSHPLGFGDLDDAINAINFLISEKAKWITGTEMIVDGGYLAS